jgi:hypothetical protein
MIEGRVRRTPDGFATPRKPAENMIFLSATGIRRIPGAGRRESEVA